MSLFPTEVLPSVAERAADQARTLPNFKNLSLPGLRTQAAEFLKSIGKVEGIFSAYTAHDISHIDAMLGMLDWIIPQPTQEVMTPIDWLLVVLGIYFHDSGMVVSQKEFNERENNPEYARWVTSLRDSAPGQDYLARARRMNADEKEQFLFQEFIRRKHATRIRDWISGRDPIPALQRISGTVAEMLKPLPRRFKEHLATICESHHSDNLDNMDLYPLSARFGSHAREVANVQYAAVVLRTVDLLHVTSDRTPSTEYQVIRFSDLKSVSEWNRHLGTFAVGSKKRRLLESDPDSSVIQISADFSEEPPFFALQEYVAYADSQIRQSKRWIDKSLLDPSGEGYQFPWHEVCGDVHLEGVPPQPMRFELDRGRLLDLLVGHTIYNDPTVAIRELLQNSIDATRFFHHLERDRGGSTGISSEMGEVIVTWNAPERLLTVEDRGTGMDRDTIVHHLMNVGSSFYNTPQFETQYGDFTPISRFGIGILTCFMVSDDIEIVTIRASCGYRLKMTSVHAHYLLRKLEDGDPRLLGLGEHGTRVVLRLRESVDLRQRSVEDILRHWIVLPECRVVYQDSTLGEKTQIGFTEPSDALKYYLDLEQPNEDSSKRKRAPVPHELVTKSHRSTSGRARYDLCFATERDQYLPEREFAKLDSDERSASIVCVQGIRVSDNLPGLDRSICALLAVSGCRELRTTVSRSGLEEDAEYHRVGRICIDLLFEHVRDEVERISKSSGNPLSRASSAASWLSSSLRLTLNGAERVQYLDEQVGRLPHIVVERADGTRTLASESELRQMPTIWTLESRLVDSIGLISRDLGRELSLGEFLNALAPDSKQFSFSPLLPDAGVFAESLHKSHCAAAVKFSRQHQQTAVEWRRRSAEDLALDLDLGGLVPEGLSRLLHETAHFHRKMERKGIRFGGDEKPRVDVCEIVGDVNDVYAVICRTGVILAVGSRLAEAWRTIREAVVRFARDGADLERLKQMVAVGTKFLNCVNELGGSLYSRAYYGEGGVEKWPTTARWLNGELERAGVRDRLPEDFSSLVKTGSVFNASNYWRNWNARD